MFEFIGTNMIICFSHIYYRVWKINRVNIQYYLLLLERLCI